MTALSLAASGAAWADVSVSYSAPQQFSDLPTAQSVREQVLKGLSEHFQSLGKKLPADQHLSIEVSDVDLAGREEPNSRTVNEIRVMRGGADWPHISLRYTLESGGKVLRSGKDELSDMSYLNRINGYASGDRLRYEKKMIDEWFAKQFGAKAP
ncbi:DUF3016 domain-containing protein [Janthinobacterium fluminis]|uniref:DUF3016 domain-containing protein n=1 Tax=Janthinobacterium fluminis TaxID=2987524 RepID=A0ABT5K6W7_9BURK|nr:DUF3016 domain-containing protein [Janthinobacterium fluminis]MDC8760745.1 DUF3016 domain-containing protein [Janthinobacterium fluminis]